MLCIISNIYDNYMYLPIITFGKYQLSLIGRHNFQVPKLNAPETLPPDQYDLLCFVPATDDRRVGPGRPNGFVRVRPGPPGRLSQDHLLNLQAVPARPCPARLGIIGHLATSACSSPGRVDGVDRSVPDSGRAGGGAGAGAAAAGGG